MGQLKEVYGMTEELWSKAAPFLVVDTTGLKKVEINFSALPELGRHPYIGFKTARRLLRHRDENGKYLVEADLCPFFSADSLKRLLPYILFGEGTL